MTPSRADLREGAAGVGGLAGAVFAPAIDGLIGPDRANVPPACADLREGTHIGGVVSYAQSPPDDLAVAQDSSGKAAPRAGVLIARRLRRGMGGAENGDQCQDNETEESRRGRAWSYAALQRTTCSSLPPCPSQASPGTARAGLPEPERGPVFGAVD